MKYFKPLLTSLWIICISGEAALVLSEEQAQQMAEKIWHNECRGTIKGLTSWNEGEEFASLGIGHFIWYPEGKRGPFQETFPALLAFLEKRGATPPAWLKKQRYCPWYVKQDFDQDFFELNMRQLRDFLFETRTLQALFMAERLEKSLPKMLAAVPEKQRQHVETLFNRLSQDPRGTFMLLDYINFKGDGTDPSERYAGEGWGLLQVLQAMPASSEHPHEDFIAAAKKALSCRVQNALKIRNEDRWIKGWYKRVESY